MPETTAPAGVYACGCGGAHPLDTKCPQPAANPRPSRPTSAALVHQLGGTVTVTDEHIRESGGATVETWWHSHRPGYELRLRPAGGA